MTKQIMNTSLELNGRKVVDVEVDGVDTSDYPDFCDCYFSSDVFEDDGTELNEDELYALGEKYGTELNILAHETFH